MGADLYISSLYDKAYAKWQPLFQKAAARRDRLTPGTKAHQAAQRRVEFYYSKMQRGYFRDSYNDWDLLWKFGLSWWTDIIPLLDMRNRLTVRAANKFLAMLKEREPAFQANLAKDSFRERRYFRRKYRQLQQFLGEAISLKSPVDCCL